MLSTSFVRTVGHCKIITIKENLIYYQLHWLYVAIYADSMLKNKQIKLSGGAMLLIPKVFNSNQDVIYSRNRENFGSIWIESKNNSKNSFFVASVHNDGK